MPSVDAPSSKSNQEAQSQDMNHELRRALSGAIGALSGRQTTESFYAVTWEELAQQQIQRIEGTGTAARPTELERIDRLEQVVLSAVAKIREIPPERFLPRDRNADVNTPLNPL